MLLKVEFEKPTGASIDDVAEFVLSALSSWGGGLHPEDPMFHSLDEIRSITIHGKLYHIHRDKGGRKEAVRDGR